MTYDDMSGWYEFDDTPAYPVRENDDGVIHGQTLIAIIMVGNKRLSISCFCATGFLLSLPQKMSSRRERGKQSRHMSLLQGIRRMYFSLSQFMSTIP